MLVTIITDVNIQNFSLFWSIFYTLIIIYLLYVDQNHKLFLLKVLFLLKLNHLQCNPCVIFIHAKPYNIVKINISPSRSLILNAGKSPDLNFLFLYLYCRFKYSIYLTPQTIILLPLLALARMEQ